MPPTLAFDYESRDQFVYEMLRQDLSQ